jgi:cytidylate kinase
MSTARKLVIAIDGPAGSGKSTIAARLAKKLGYVNLESGAMYRALALKAMERQVSLDDGEALRELAASNLAAKATGCCWMVAMFRSAYATPMSPPQHRAFPSIRGCAR